MTSRDLTPHMILVLESAQRIAFKMIKTLLPAMSKSEHDVARQPSILIPLGLKS